MSGKVVPALAARGLARLRLFINQVQGFVTGEEIDPFHFSGAHASDVLHELKRLDHAVRHGVKFAGERRVPSEIEIPELGMMQVSKASLDQRANEIQRQRRAFVGAQQELRVGCALGLGKSGAVHQISAIAREGDAGPGFDVVRARLGILTGEASHADYWLAAALHQHQAHLQQNFQFVGDGVGGAIVKLLCAITTLQEEPLALRRLGELAL